MQNFTTPHAEHFSSAKATCQSAVRTASTDPRRLGRDNDWFSNLWAPFRLEAKVPQEIVDFLLVLRGQRPNANGTITITCQQLADALNCSVSSVKRYRAVARSRGWLHVVSNYLPYAVWSENHGMRHRQPPNVYSLSGLYYEMALMQRQHQAASCAHDSGNHSATISRPNLADPTNVLDPQKIGDGTRESHRLCVDDERRAPSAQATLIERITANLQPAAAAFNERNMPATVGQHAAMIAATGASVDAWAAALTDAIEVVRAEQEHLQVPHPMGMLYAVTRGTLATRATANSPTSRPIQSTTTRTRVSRAGSAAAGLTAAGDPASHRTVAYIAAVAADHDLSPETVPAIVAAALGEISHVAVRPVPPQASPIRAR